MTNLGKHLQNLTRARRGYFLSHMIEDLAQEICDAGSDEDRYGIERGFKKVLLDLYYLDAKLSYEGLGLSKVIEDFVLASDRNLSDEHIINQSADFLRKNSQKLTELDNLLFSLCLHEGPPVVLEQARRLDANTSWDKPYFRLVPQWVPLSSPGSLREYINILSQWNYPSTPAVGLASKDRPCTFHSLGKSESGEYRIGLVNLWDGLPSPDLMLSIRNEPLRSRPIQLYASPDGRYLVTLLSSGNAQLWSLNAEDARPTLLSTFSYLQPTRHTALMEFEVDYLLYQENEGAVVKLELLSLQQQIRFQNLLPDTEIGELSGIVNLNKNIIITIRSEKGTYFFCILPDGSYTQLDYFKEKDVLSMCNCGYERIAVAFSDHKLCVFTVLHDQIGIHQVVEGIRPSQMVWTGEKLLWITVDGTFWGWAIDEPTRSPEKLDTETSTLRGVKHLKRSSDNSLALAAQSTTFRFVLSQQRQQVHKIVKYLLPSQILPEGYYALVEQNNEIWLWDSVKRIEKYIARQPQFVHKAFYDRDGQGQVLLTGQPNILLDLEKGTISEVKNFPNDVTSIAGDDSGGFWLTNLSGNIYFVNGNAVCNQIKTSPLDDIKKSHIYSWGSLVVWIGTCVYQTDAGGDLTDVVLFFRSASPRQNHLELISQRFFAVSDGLYSGIVFNPTTNKFWIFWHNNAKYRNANGLTVKIGTPEDFLQNQERDELLKGIPFGLISVVTTRDGMGLFCLSDSGDLYFVNMETLQVQATFSSSKRIETMALSLINARSLLLAFKDATVFSCDLVGGDHDPRQ